jgi:hypothetical protein
MQVSGQLNWLRPTEQSSESTARHRLMIVWMTLDSHTHEKENIEAALVRKKRNTDSSRLQCCCFDSVFTMKETFTEHDGKNLHACCGFTQPCSIAPVI